jgi:hypothetical protein
VHPTSGFSSFHLPVAILVVLCLFCAPLPAQKNSGSSRAGRDGNIVQTPTYSLRGKVVDIENHAQLEGVRVELRSFGGATVGTTFTRAGGDFEFLSIGSGTYDLVVLQAGYHTITQRIDVDQSVFGLSIDLHPVSAENHVPPGLNSVSSRELSIPRKAHEAMVKGLALMNEKSDYQGSLKQFERAIQEYPEYYEAYTQMAIAYLHTGNGPSAEVAVRKAVELSQGQYVDGLFWLATLLNDSQRFADAEPVARKAIELDSNSWQANAELARSLLGLNRPDEAEKSALAAAKARPGNPLLYLILANIHTQLGNRPALLEDLNNYLRLVSTGSMADQARAQRKQLQVEMEGTQEASPATTLKP